MKLNLTKHIKDIAQKHKSKRHKIFFLTAGILSTIWFLIRVIPKPSRANYPCMKIAAPFMSSLVIYLMSISGLMFSFNLGKQKLRKHKILGFAGALVIGLISLMLFISNQKQEALAYNFENNYTNQAYGVPQGAKPGRVTWMWDNRSTNESCNITNVNDAYFLPKNTDIEIVQEMVNKSIIHLAGVKNIRKAWDELFIYFNKKKEKGEVAYQEGEKIFIKANLVGQWGMNDNFDINTGNYKAGHTTPQVLIAVVQNLVDEVGVKQENISLGDPIQKMPQQYIDIISKYYPHVNFICSKGTNGRTKAIQCKTPQIFYSDKGAILREGDPNSWENSHFGDKVFSDRLYTIITEADYMINIANMKAHERAGISLCAKNHFGSHGRTYAKHLHMGLVHPNQRPDSYSRDEYGKYRVLVDIMGHEKLGGNTLLYVIDGLYSADGAGSKVLKSQSAPFNNDWMSSIFMSQDHVAIEAVALDFLREEYHPDHQDKTYPHYNAIEDYLLQAADSEFWPENISYDPENDGTPIKSLGVFESWNNATEKLYSKNFSPDANGIELIQVHKANTGSSSLTELNDDIIIYPNPFANQLTIKLPGEGTWDIKIYDVNGKKVYQNSKRTFDAMQFQVKDLNKLTKGQYIINVQNENSIFIKKAIKK